MSDTGYQATYDHEVNADNNNDADFPKLSMENTACAVAIMFLLQFLKNGPMSTTWHQHACLGRRIVKLSAFNGDLTC